MTEQTQDLMIEYYELYAVFVKSDKMSDLLIAEEKHEEVIASLKQKH